MQREFNEDHTPLGYLITFRTYGTWLHGDQRGSRSLPQSLQVRVPPAQRSPAHVVSIGQTKPGRALNALTRRDECERMAIGKKPIARGRIREAIDIFGTTAVWPWRSSM